MHTQMADQWLYCWYQMKLIIYTVILKANFQKSSYYAKGHVHVNICKTLSSEKAVHSSLSSWSEYM